MYNTIYWCADIIILNRALDINKTDNIYCSLQYDNEHKTFNLIL